MRERKKPTKSFIARSIEEIEKEAFKKGYEAGRHAMIEWLRELQRGYEPSRSLRLILPIHSLRNLNLKAMVSKKTRKNRQKADIRLAIHLLSMRQMNLTTSVNDALLAMWQRIDDLQKEVEQLKEKEERK